MSTIRTMKRATERILSGTAGCIILGGIALTGCQPGAHNVPDAPPAAKYTYFTDPGQTADQLQPGAYTTVVPPAKSQGEPDSCYYEVFTDWARTQRRTNGFASEGQTVTIHILAGDTWVNSTGCGRWVLATIAPSD